jgi:hypothetical protein
MRESLRPSTERYKIYWDKRMGFAKLAIKAQVPIILAACPKADDLYDVYPNILTKLAYQHFRIPLFFARGLGISPIPRPIKLVHYISRPIVPPKFEGDEPPPELIKKFHARIVRRMKLLMAKAIISDEK